VGRRAASGGRDGEALTGVAGGEAAAVGGEVCDMSPDTFTSSYIHHRITISRSAIRIELELCRFKNWGYP
jgi:hypothetical protein